MPTEALVFLSVHQCRTCFLKRTGIFTQLEKRKRYGNNKEKRGENMYVVAEMKPCVCGKFNYQARGLRFFQDHKVKKIWCVITPIC